MSRALNTYSDLILEHYRDPRHYGTVKKATFRAAEENVFCGDRIEVSGILKNGKIKEAKFKGAGCVISQASASLLVDYIIGKSPDNAQKLGVIELQNLLGIKLSPTRLKCVELSLLALKKAIGQKGRFKRIKA